MEKYKSKESFVSSNTSSIPINLLCEGRSKEFKKNFCGTHFFNPARYMRLLEIIPQTETAGARTARVTAFIDTILSDAEATARDQFVNGIGWIDQRSMELFGSGFVGAAVDQQTALLTILSARENTTPADAVGVEFFQALKSLTVTGYYTSRIGMLQELDDDGSNYFDEKLGCQHPEHKSGN